MAAHNKNLFIFSFDTMKKFLFQLVLFLIIPFISVLLLILNIVRYTIPPPQLSSSLSLNAKLEFIKAQKKKQFDILAIGSSISLDNINSREMTNYFGENYLNCSAWGQNMKENYQFLKLYYSHFHPQIIFTVGNYMDFNNNEKTIKIDQVSDYLFGNYSPIKTYIDFKYLLKTPKEYYLTLQSDKRYDYLKFDKNGGINFNPKNFQINPSRWDGYKFSELNISAEQFEYLDSIAVFCREKQIPYVFIQSPFRENYVKNLTGDERIQLKNQKKKTHEILRKNGQQYIDGQNMKWDDSLFVDYAHFNRDGSSKFTKYFLEQLKK